MIPAQSLFLIGFFAIGLIVTMIAARKNKSSSAYLIAGRHVTATQNAFAVAGDYIAAASLLGIVGATSLNGLSGFFYALAVPLSFVLLAILLAEPLRNLGRYTLTDILSFRFPGRGLRLVSGFVSVVISLFYLLGNFIGAGVLMSSLLHITYGWGLLLGSAVIAIYVVFGGMIAVTWIQIIKTIALIMTITLLISLVLAALRWSPLALFREAVIRIGPRMIQASRPPTLAGKLDLISLEMAGIGLLGLPHVLIRFLTVPDAGAARKSIAITVWIITLITAANGLLGLGAAVLVGPSRIAAANPGGTMATPLLANLLGGQLLSGFVTAVIFAAIAAVVSGVVVSLSGTIAHDIYANVIRPQTSEKEKLNVARAASLAVCGFGLAISAGASSVNLSFMAGVSMAIAGAANLPVLLFTVFWSRFNRAGAMFGLVGGMLSALGFFLLSPTIMGRHAVIPIPNVAILSIPSGFVWAIVGSAVGHWFPSHSIAFEEVSIQAATGERRS